MSSLSPKGVEETDSVSFSALDEEWNARQNKKLEDTLVAEPLNVEDDKSPKLKEEEAGKTESDHIVGGSTNEMLQSTMMAEPPTLEGNKPSKEDDVESEAEQIVERSINEMNQPTSPEALVNEFGDEVFPIREEGEFFDIVLAKRNVGPLYMMDFPEEVHSKLPSSTVPATIHCNSKIWTTTFVRDKVRMKLESSTWRNFVTDNKLKADDCLVFEVMERTAEEIKFRVQILRFDVPSELETMISPCKVINLD